MSVVLDTFFYGRPPARLDDMLDLLILLFSPALGLVFAEELLSDSEHVYGVLVAGGSLIGMLIGLATRPSDYWWYPPLPNALWVSAWTYGAAFAGALLIRSSPMSIRTATITYMLAIFAAVSLAYRFLSV